MSGPDRDVGPGTVPDSRGSCESYTGPPHRPFQFYKPLTRMSIYYCVSMKSCKFLCTCLQMIWTGLLGYTVKEMIQTVE